MDLESPSFIHQMFIKSLLLTRHPYRHWDYRGKGCDLKELKVYVVETSNKQMHT